MDLKNINGQIIGWSTISDDILKYHCSTSQVVEKRHLDFKDQASLLDELSKVIDNKTLFNRIKRALEKNDAEETRRRQLLLLKWKQKLLQRLRLKSSLKL